MTGLGLFLLFVTIVIVIYCFKDSRKDNTISKKIEGIDEDLSYSFGFPTRYDDGLPVRGYGTGYNQYPGYGAWDYPYVYHPQGYGPGAWYTPPSIRRREREERRRLRSQWTARCYSADKEDDCLPGYRNHGIDTDEDGANDKWKCCRRG